jgi:hypothetical protein
MKIYLRSMPLDKSGNELRLSGCKPTHQPVSLLSSERVIYLPVEIRAAMTPSGNVPPTLINHAGEGQTAPGLKGAAVSTMGRGRCSVLRGCYNPMLLMVRWAERQHKKTAYHTESAPMSGSREPCHGVLCQPPARSVRCGGSKTIINQAMKITIIENPKSNLETFAEANDLHMIVMERDKDFRNSDSRYYAQFEGAWVKEGGFLAGKFGNGRTPEEAIVDYIPRISEQTIVFGDGTTKRRELKVPILL